MKRDTLNVKAMNALVCTLSEELNRVLYYGIAKEIMILLE